MFIAAALLSCLLAAAITGSAIAKLVRSPHIVDTMRNVGYPLDKLWIPSVVELVAATGLVAGLEWWPIGVAAAVGTALFFAIAVWAHLRAKDPGHGPAAGFLVLAVVAAGLRLAAA
ncbi:DoxX family protein [Lentzea sp. NPDC060358]|uniref:DoxX family protein n=1 Tax=Lentzea sp. NPDC060358 TaxID=3347103 RepID=UPI0036623F7F